MPTFTSGFRILSMFCAILLLTACDESKAETKAGAQKASPPAEVGIVTLKTEDIPLRVELPGRTSAYQVAEIRPQVSGIILKRLFEEGSEVAAGQQLYQIDPAAYQVEFNTAAAQLKRAQAVLKSVRAKTGRYKDLVANGAVSRQEYDDAVAGLAEAEADVAIAEAAQQTAQLNLTYTKVLSPIAGHIGKSAITAGALVTANQAAPLAVVQQLDPIYVDVTQSSSELMQLRQKIAGGQVAGGGVANTPVNLVLDDVGQKYAHAGTLKFSDVTVDEATGSVQLRALFPNPEGQLLPGLFVRAVLQQGQLSQALLVPQQAVTRGANDQVTAWVVDGDNKVQVRPIKAAQAMGDKWVVTEGLAAGDRVVVEGTIKLQPGAVVKPVAIADKSAAPAADAGPEKTAPAAGR